MEVENAAVLERQAAEVWEMDSPHVGLNSSQIFLYPPVLNCRSHKFMSVNVLCVCLSASHVALISM